MHQLEATEATDQFFVTPSMTLAHAVEHWPALAEMNSFLNKQLRKAKLDAGLLHISPDALPLGLAKVHGTVFLCRLPKMLEGKLGPHLSMTPTSALVKTVAQGGRFPTDARFIFLAGDTIAFASDFLSPAQQHRRDGEHHESVPPDLAQFEK